MIWSLVLDVVLIALLATTIGVVYVLHRKLGEVRAGQGELERVSLAFAEAASRAEDSITRLKLSATGVQQQVEQAERLCDDLRYLIERGTGLADRLENEVQQARAIERPRERPQRATARPTSRATADKPETLGDAASAPKPAFARDLRPGTHAPGNRGDSACRRDSDTLPPPRSQAERELLSALRAAGLAPR
jgi:hypothetical protein